MRLACPLTQALAPFVFAEARCGSQNLGKPLLALALHVLRHALHDRCAVRVLGFQAVIVCRARIGSAVGPAVTPGCSMRYARVRGLHTVGPTVLVLLTRATQTGRQRHANGNLVRKTVHMRQALPIEWACIRARSRALPFLCREYAETAAAVGILLARTANAPLRGLADALRIAFLPHRTFAALSRAAIIAALLTSTGWLTAVHQACLRSFVEKCTRTADIVAAIPTVYWASQPVLALLASAVATSRSTILRATRRPVVVRFANPVAANLVLAVGLARERILARVAGLVAARLATVRGAFRRVLAAVEAATLTVAASPATIDGTHDWTLAGRTEPIPADATIVRAVLDRLAACWLAVLIPAQARLGWRI